MNYEKTTRRPKNIRYKYKNRFFFFVSRFIENYKPSKSYVDGQLKNIKSNN